VRIVLISDWFAEKMGYSENCLPRSLAALGHDVHLITSDAQPYFDSPGYAETYAPFVGPGLVATGVKPFEGYTLHRLPHGRFRGRLRIQGMRSALLAVRPEIVQTFEAFSVSTLEAAIAQPTSGYRLFLESHVHASVFSSGAGAGFKQKLFLGLYPRTLGALVSWRAEKCYPISIDAAEIAVNNFGIAPKKIQVSSLGVDTDLFHPPVGSAALGARSALRARLGFDQDDIVCIYTGRFARDKGPHLLGQAIDYLYRRGEPFRGLFVGSGTEAETAALRDYAGCQQHPFVPASQLPPLYWAADIGVWPKQESTSQLDAAACGLPIILSNRPTVKERVDGNGLTYVEGSQVDLAETIQRLRRAEVRQRLGQAGSKKMQATFGWDRIALARTADYAAALESRGH
jgi:glycosyltransferase involved in cell wall biosynthesis